MATIRERIEENLGRRRNQEIKDPKGGAATKLAKSMRANPGAVSAVLRRMEADGQIEREGTERRTFKIRLITVEEIPTPATNGQQAVVETADFRAQFNALLDGLMGENSRLAGQLSHAERRIEALEVENAALKRDVKESRNSAQLILDIEKKLAELKG